MNDAKPIPAGAPPTAASQRNGAVSLSDRVQSLRLPDRPAAQPVGQWWLPWLLCLMLGGVAVVFAFRSSGPDPAQLEEFARLRQEMETLQKGAGNLTTLSSGQRQASGKVVLDYKGYVVPVQQIKVSPEISAKVMKLHITEGMKVKAGQVLAELDEENYAAKLRQAQQGVKAAEARLRELTEYRDKEAAQIKAELEEARAQRKQLFLNWERTQALGPGRAVTQTEYEQAQSQYLAQDARAQRLQLAWELLSKLGPRDEKIGAVRAEIEQAKAELRQAEWTFDRTIVKAPRDGIVLSKRAEVGDLVNPAAFNISAAICDMADLTQLEVDVPIPERDIGKVKDQMPCEVRLEAYPSMKPLRGVVSRIMPIADRAKGAVAVRVLLLDIQDNNDTMLVRPEMGALVAFLNENEKGQKK